MYTEYDLLPLSGLQHRLFCERQCALIHVECDPHVLYAIRSLFMRLNNLFAIFFM
jgi:hypothetical protein